MMDGILKVKDIFVSYGEKNVIEGVSFSMDKGEIICIVGESGSGKSTLLKAVLKSEEIFVTGGEIEIQRGISPGIITQNPGASFNPIRPYSVQIDEALSSNRIKRSREDICRTLSALGLKDADRALRSRPYELSGGMNQRMAIATAMLLGNNLLLCDEATSALDVVTAKNVVLELLRINKENRTAILMVTHNLGIAGKMADHIGIMKSGRLIEYGSREKILTSPEKEYTRQLLRDVPKLRIGTT